MAVYLSKVNLKCGNYNLTGYAAFFNLVQTPELVMCGTKSLPKAVLTERDRTIYTTR